MANRTSSSRKADLAAKSSPFVPENNGVSQDDLAALLPDLEKPVQMHPRAMWQAQAADRKAIMMLIKHLLPTARTTNNGAVNGE
jgi:hypothetical protein